MKSKAEARVKELEADNQKWYEAFHRHMCRADKAEAERDRLEAEYNEYRSLEAGDRTGHLLRCARVNGKWVCADGCPKALVDELVGALQEWRSRGFLPDCSACASLEANLPDGILAKARPEPKP